MTGDYPTETDESGNTNNVFVVPSAKKFKVPTVALVAPFLESKVEPAVVVPEATKESSTTTLNEDAEMEAETLKEKADGMMNRMKSSLSVNRKPSKLWSKMKKIFA